MATYTILYTYKVLIVVQNHFSFVAFVNFVDFSVCRIHVILDNFTIWCTAIVSAPRWIGSNRPSVWKSRDVVTVFSLSSIINIYIYLESVFDYHPIALYIKGTMHTKVKHSGATKYI